MIFIHLGEISMHHCQIFRFVYIKCLDQMFSTLWNEQIFRAYSTSENFNYETFSAIGFKKLLPNRSFFTQLK